MLDLNPQMRPTIEEIIYRALKVNLVEMISVATLKFETKTVKMP